MASACPRESYCQVANCRLARKHSTFVRPKNDRPVDKSQDAAPFGAHPSNTENEARIDQAQNCFVGVKQGLYSATRTGVTVTGLAIVPVKVRAKGKDKMNETYALLVARKG